ncbi:Mobile element protein [Caballeronia sordidicola]|uniref:Mobile element protein n=1 Tax=Caballeronia sordidicola TaxID=196367 RepID=A0A242MX36_CABSO|nr:Mobile element protein [Caballeronia sordidicola]
MSAVQRIWRKRGIKPQRLERHMVSKAWCRTRHPVAKTARQSCCQTLLQACAAFKPGKIVTDQLRGYPAAKAEIPELANVKHVFVKAAARLNNRAENSHQPTRERERRMRGFRDPKRTQKFLSCFGPIRELFALKRHLLRASLHRKQLAVQFVAWREFAQNPSTAF